MIKLDTNSSRHREKDKLAEVRQEIVSVSDHNLVEELCLSFL